MEVRGRVKNSLELIYNYYLNIGITDALKITILGMILLIGAYIRLLPLRYGAFISEFDPYLQYYGAKVIVEGVKEKGLFGILEFFNHHISLTWQPEGVDLGARYYPGVPYFGAITYLILSYLGFNVTLESIGVYLPVVFALFGILSIYVIAKELKDEFTGFLSAIFYAVSPTVIPRSNLGWFDTDGFGLPLMFISIVFFIKALKTDTVRRKMLFASLSGLFAGLMGITWGGFIYLYSMFILFTIVVIFTIGLPKDYEYIYIPLTLIMDIIVTSIPRGSQTYLTGILAILQYISIILVLTDKFIDYKSLLRDNIKLISTATLIVLFGIIILPLFPSGLGARTLSVIYPAYKEVSRIVSTVQEQAGASFAYFFRGVFILIPFAVYGFYLLLKKVDYTGIFIMLFALTSLYISTNFVRLIIISTPFLVILGAYGIQSLYSELLRKLYTSKKGGKFAESPSIIKSIIVVVSFILILLSTYFSYNVSVMGASYPATILTGGSPFVSHDWLEALEWMRANIPDDSVVAAWWDYGYWISFIAGKKSLADNGTLNASRIEQLARMFLSDEDTAIKIMKELGADYVLIYLGTAELQAQGGQRFYVLYGFGEDGKFIQMARIIGEDPNKYLNRTSEDTSIYTDEFWNTFLGRLIPYQFFRKEVIQNRQVDVYFYSQKYPTEPDGKSKLILVYRSNDPGPGEVLIYKLVEN